MFDGELDDWLDTPSGTEEENYAKFALEFMRMPAWKQISYKAYIEPFKLFCVHDAKVYRVTMGSRMGDIGLTDQYDRDYGYQKRVNVKMCSCWSRTAEEASKKLLGVCEGV